MSSSGERYLVNSVHSYSSGTVGRSLNTVGHHHFVIDSPTLGEEITSGDAFLAGISSCGVNLVERAAQELGVPVQRTEVTIDGLRDRDAPRPSRGSTCASSWSARPRSRPRRWSGATRTVDRSTARSR